ncbi:mitochondrial uncoupling protein 4-like isoform X2 [Artemia franciscana]|uniref:Mitochondrial uncoupling protein 4 n=1 Tax=Artemia franciscana TaxID=6661 RepID=A0AA88HAY1_ARTSF|nr:hypothetical protein QYM36_017875 [Artemia franciscana]KAK2703719.1 hypothetical protein QYM36_017875 [Artemia franciscana]KAK2703725.1 hypothetical protein QYM36_017875 [Artemia franciscana]
MTTTNPIHVISPKPSVGHDVTYVDSFWFKYILSSLSASVAETVTYPLDLTKTRLQIQGERAKIAESGLKHTPYRGMVATMLGIIREEGFTNLWKGLSPAIYRHLVYSGIRMATYEYMRDNVLQKKSDGSFPLWKSALGGMTAGAVGQFCANPTDLIKVQMQMEGRRRLEGKPPRVKGVIEAASQILREGGVRGLWKGWAPNVQRGALVNLGDLTTYDTAKHFFLSHTSLKDGHLVHIMSSVCAGFVGATMATPADVIKSRIMNQPTDSKGRGLTYKSSIECLMATIRNEGAFALYKGFIPTWIRMAPWSLTFWLSYEQIRNLAGTASF